MNNSTERLCPECKIGLLYPHPENYKVKFQYHHKCSICGYVKEIKNNSPFSRILTTKV